MSIKQFPVEFKGYHNGDAGLIYPNSSTMLNCRLNHHDAVEQIKGYTFYPSALSSATSSLSAVGQIDAMYEYNHRIIYDDISQAQMFLKRISIPGAPNTWLIRSYKYEYGVLSLSSNFTSGGGDITDFTARFSTFLDKIIATQCASSAGSIFSPIGMQYAVAGSNTWSTLSVCPPYPAFNSVHYNRLFVASQSVSRSTIWWSDIDTINTWNASNTLNVNTDDGDFITGLQSYKGDLYVFKSKNVYKIVGDNYNAVSGNYAVTKLEGIPGALNQKAICTANGNLYWVSKQYIVEYNGSSFEYIDYPYLIDDRDIMTFAFNVDVEPFILQHNEKEHEIVFLRRGTSTWYAYDYLQKQWSKHSISDTTLNIQSMMEHTELTTGVKNLMIGSDSKYSFLFGDYRTFVNSVLSNIAINTYYETDWMDLGTWFRKDGVKIFVDTKQDGVLSAHPYSLSCLTYYDYDTTPIDTQVFACDGATNQLHSYYPEVQTFRRIKLRFANNVLDTRAQINRAVIEYDLIDESGRIG